MGNVLGAGGASKTWGARGERFQMGWGLGRPGGTEGSAQGAVGARKGAWGQQTDGRDGGRGGADTSDTMAPAGWLKGRWCEPRAWPGHGNTCTAAEGLGGRCAGIPTCAAGSSRLLFLCRGRAGGPNLPPPIPPPPREPAESHTWPGRSPGSHVLGAVPRVKPPIAAWSCKAEQPRGFPGTWLSFLVLLSRMRTGLWAGALPRAVFAEADSSTSIEKPVCGARGSAPCFSRLLHTGESSRSKQTRPGRSALPFCHGPLNNFALITAQRHARQNISGLFGGLLPAPIAQPCLLHPPHSCSQGLQPCGTVLWQHGLGALRSVPVEH